MATRPRAGKPAFEDQNLPKPEMKVMVLTGAPVGERGQPGPIPDGAARLDGWARNANQRQFHGSISRLVKGDTVASRSDRLPRNADETRAFINRLVRLWDRDREKPFTIGPDYPPSTGAMIWGLSNHNIEIARTVVDLFNQGRMLIAMPLVRLAIDNAVTAAWLSVSPIATGALVHESLRQKKSAIAQIVQMGAEGFDAESLARAAAELEEWEDKKSPLAGNMEQRFKAVSGEQAYNLYRIASSMSHASMNLADTYMVHVDATPDNSLGIEFNPDGRLFAEDAWLGVLASMILLSMNTCDQISEPSRFKNQLAKMSRDFGVPTAVKLATDPQ